MIYCVATIKETCLYNVPKFPYTEFNLNLGAIGASMVGSLIFNGWVGQSYHVPCTTDKGG